MGSTVVGMSGSGSVVLSEEDVVVAGEGDFEKFTRWQPRAKLLMRVSIRRKGMDGLLITPFSGSVISK
jgi:hypothetical protein